MHPLYVEGMTCGELKKFIEDTYDLDEFVGDCLEVSFKQKIGQKGNEKLVVIDDNADPLK